jgi:poly-gamma-glutamate capsule biosynthesis protein CapA/YwtB (metallophosphatase superfamily)
VFFVTRPHHKISYFLLIILVFSQFSGCGKDTDFNKEYNAVISEKALNDNWQANRLVLSGTLVDQAGSPVSGASVSFAAQNVITDVNGGFGFSDLPPTSGMLQIDHVNFHSETLPVYLQLPETSTGTVLNPIILTALQSPQVRFLFGGDVSFGRRFLDPDEITPRDQIPVDNPAAQILVSNPAPGTREVVKWLRPWYQDADWGVINLETPVTNNPSTPHVEKPFAFFTLPGSLDALTWLGIDYVSLGNNHVYDYLEIGLNDTLLNLNNVGLLHSGAGASPAEAFTANRQTIKNQNYAFISATSVAGAQYGISFVADANKGGAADLTQSADIIASIQAEVNAGYIPIVQLHTGKEYTYTPTVYAAGRMLLATDNGAALVVSHHPHVAQGISINNGVVTIEGLGNLAFDQSRLETFLGLMARVDMSAGNVDGLRLLPVYLKKFAPLPLSGDLANRFLRRIGEYSNGRGAVVYPYQQQGFVALNATQVSSQVVTKNINITLSDSGSAIIDLRTYASSDASLSMIETPANVSLQMGRDMMLYGDFEDWDMDENSLEAAHWDTTGASRFVCLSNPLRGTAGLCSARDSTDKDDSVSAFRNRIRVLGDALDVPNKNLSLLGYMKGDNAGKVNIVARYYASEGEQTFGEELAFSRKAGSYDWNMFNAKLTMPADDGARATRIFIRHSPPSNGEALVAFDEMAVINWEENVSSGSVLNTPHARDFVQVQGAAGLVVSFTLTFVRYLPVYN